jgi:hypothetical protein
MDNDRNEIEISLAGSYQASDFIWLAIDGPAPQAWRASTRTRQGDPLRGRPPAGLDGRGRRAFLTHVGSGENAAFRLTRENDYPAGPAITRESTITRQAATAAYGANARHPH